MFALWHDQKGESMLTLPVLILIVCMVLYMGVDIFGIYVTNQKLRTVVSETLTVMKMYNGWDERAEAFYNDMLTKVGLDPTRVKIDERTLTDENINRGDMVTLEISTTYKVRSLKPLNKEIIVPIRVRLSGVAQMFKQPGG
ncbi:hypothetical protein Tfer_2282 [Thermincola ferriacetica]|uniref:Uncharacterized protein n=2 Tax=Thermincola TaxID=278993 RepID=D5XCQ0_THEPJ|nr:MULTISPECIES: DUF4320 family protein [Thermincola]ADG81676.1 hypothetical protein TherJR_0809 [Thermincola potens JR]KNZ69038.1 hypothetical protein Tfer_2282 [Thermincola ferriacetica]